MPPQASLLVKIVLFRCENVFLQNQNCRQGRGGGGRGNPAYEFVGQTGSIALRKGVFTNPNGGHGRGAMLPTSLLVKMVLLRCENVFYKPKL